MSEDEPHPIDALMDVYWRRHADELEEPHRTQLHDALDIFAESRDAAVSSATDPEETP